jgi:DNA excision repair protein ERCC-5
MRLLYHRIKPVIVFDGIMPEVKRREIQRRRDRQEKLWRDDDDNEGGGEDGGGGAGGALKRAAKKILVKRLKEWREKEAVMLKEKKCKEQGKNGDDNAKDMGDLERTKTSNAGALSVGFNLEDHNTSTSKSQQLSQCANTSDDIISIDDSVEADYEQSNTEDRQPQHDHNYESENDWEMSHAIQQSIDDSINQHQGERKRKWQSSSGAVANSDKSDNDDNDSVYENPSAKQNTHFKHDADNEIIASLPNESRHQWIDSQYRAHRIQSRSECLRAAADPQEYSSTQLRNFLKNSMLTKRVGTIGKLVEIRKEFESFNGGNSDRGSHVGGNSTTQQQTRRPELQRLRRKNESASSDDDDDNELFDTTISSKIGPSMKVLFGNDDSDSNDDMVNNGSDCDGGFLPPSWKATVQTQCTKDKAIELRESESDEENTSQSSINRCFATNENVITDTTGNAPHNSETTAIESSRLSLDWTNANQEWAEWGGEIDENVDVMQVGMNDVNRTVSRMKEPEGVLDDTDSNSEEDETFFTFGNTSKTEVAAGIIHSVPNLPDSKTSDIVLEDAEDNVLDWEDCDSEATDGTRLSNNQDNVEREIDHPIKYYGASCDDKVDKLAITSTQIMPEKLKEVEDAYVDWEDCNSANNHIETEGDEFKDQTLDFDSYNEIACENDELDAYHDVPQVAALKRAQATASKLTSWAGRAFERAISELAVDPRKSDMPAQNSNQVNTVKEHIDLTTGHDQTEDDCDGIVQNDQVDDHRLSAPPHGFFLDTSLNGLTEAHNAILKEERTMERDMSTITEEMKEDILKLLHLCGIPWVESPSEAEAQCAALEELGLVDGIVTEDSDIFIFGGKKVYKNFFDEKQYVEAYFARDIERDLALKRHQLVALAMLLGGDYTDGVKGVGIVNGMELLQAFPVSDSDDGIRDGLKQFREWLDGFGDPSLDESDELTSLKVKTFHKKHHSARTRWVAPADFPSAGIIKAYLHPVVDKSKVKFSWGIPNLDGLHHFCAESLGWERAETDRIVNPVLKVLENGSKQMRLESYFMRYEDGIKFAEVKSKRLKAVFHDIQGSGGDIGVNTEESTSDDGRKPPRARAPSSLLVKVKRTAKG